MIKKTLIARINLSKIQQRKRFEQCLSRLDLEMVKEGVNIAVVIPSISGFCKVPELLRNKANFSTKFSVSVSSGNGVIICSKKGFIFDAKNVSFVAGERRESLVMNLPAITVWASVVGNKENVIINSHRLDCIDKNREINLHEEELWNGFTEPDAFHCQYCGQPFDHFPERHKNTMGGFCAGVPTISKLKMPEKFRKYQPSILRARIIARKGHLSI